MISTDLDYIVELESHLEQAEDALAAEREKREAAERDRAERDEWIAKATRMITGLTGGGSEFFCRKGEQYRADLRACEEHLRDRCERHQTRAMEALQAKKEAERERDDALARLETFGKALGFVANHGRAELTLVFSAHDDLIAAIKAANGRIAFSARAALTQERKP